MYIAKYVFAKDTKITHPEHGDICVTSLAPDKHEDMELMSAAVRQLSMHFNSAYGCMQGMTNAPEFVCILETPIDPLPGMTLTYMERLDAENSGTIASGVLAQLYEAVSAVCCDPEGKVCLGGSEADNASLEQALKSSQCLLTLVGLLEQ